MSTSEDVFYLYERNSRYYHDCRLNGNMANCTYSFDNVCYCCDLQTVLPFTIGNQDTPCNFKIKCYIRPGDECPICFEKILTKSSAFITDCGHHYHKKCLSKYIQIKWQSTKYTSVARCPMCRCSLGNPIFVNRYDSSFSYKKKYGNKLDILEDFWISFDYRLPDYCSDGYDHYLGMKDNCLCCKAYREKGEFIYEF